MPLAYLAGVFAFSVGAAVAMLVADAVGGLASSAIIALFTANCLRTMGLVMLDGDITPRLSKAILVWLIPGAFLIDWNPVRTPARKLACTVCIILVAACVAAAAMYA